MDFGHQLDAMGHVWRIAEGIAGGLVVLAGTMVTGLFSKANRKSDRLRDAYARWGAAALAYARSQIAWNTKARERLFAPHLAEIWEDPNPNPELEARMKEVDVDHAKTFKSSARFDDAEAMIFMLEPRDEMLQRVQALSGRLRDAPDPPSYEGKESKVWLEETSDFLQKEAEATRDQKQELRRFLRLAGARFR